MRERDQERRGSCQARALVELQFSSQVTLELEKQANTALTHHHHTHTKTGKDKGTQSDAEEPRLRSTDICDAGQNGSVWLSASLSFVFVDWQSNSQSTERRR